MCSAATCKQKTSQFNMLERRIVSLTSEPHNGRCAKNNKIGKKMFDGHFLFLVFFFSAARALIAFSYGAFFSATSAFVTASDQMKLITDLLDSYDSKAKPTWVNSRPINVTFSMDLYQMLELVGFFGLTSVFCADEQALAYWRCLARASFLIKEAAANECNRRRL